LNSLREVCLGPAGCESRLKHLGISTAPKKSTLAYANANRPWEIYESIFMQLLGKCQAETATRSHRKFRFKNKLMSLDAARWFFLLNQSPLLQNRIEQQEPVVEDQLELRSKVHL
jgi:hypothetical protein